MFFVESSGALVILKNLKMQVVRGALGRQQWRFLAKIGSCDPSWHLVLIDEFRHTVNRLPNFANDDVIAVGARGSKRSAIFQPSRNLTNQMVL